MNVVPGAGLTHALSGIAEAFLDTVPMLVLGCGIRRDFAKAYQLHDIDQLALARPVTKAAYRIERGEEIYPEIRRACALARAGAPGPVMVEVPVNLYLTRHDVNPRALGRAVTHRGADRLDRPARSCRGGVERSRDPTAALSGPGRCRRRAPIS